MVCFSHAPRLKNHCRWTHNCHAPLGGVGAFGTFVCRQQSPFGFWAHSRWQAICHIYTAAGGGPCLDFTWISCCPGITLKQPSDFWIPPADPVESSAKTYFAGIYEQAIEILPNQFAAKCFRGWLNTRIILKKETLFSPLRWVVFSD